MKDAPGSAAPAARYHHGDLRNALMRAAQAELEAAGPEAFSLRKVARRAGVSHAAPAHHFKDARGLLTALAAEGYRVFLRAMEDHGGADLSAEDRILGAGIGYIAFACENPALFRLMFASDKPDRDDPEFRLAAEASFRHIAMLVQAHAGADPFTDAAAMADTLSVWSATHGVADLLSSGRLHPMQAMPPAAREAAAKDIIRRSLVRAPGRG